MIVGGGIQRGHTRSLVESPPRKHFIDLRCLASFRPDQPEQSAHDQEGPHPENSRRHDQTGVARSWSERLDRDVNDPAEEDPKPPTDAHHYRKRTNVPSGSTTPAAPLPR